MKQTPANLRSCEQTYSSLQKKLAKRVTTSPGWKQLWPLQISQLTVGRSFRLPAEGQEPRDSSLFPKSHTGSQTPRFATAGCPNVQSQSRLTRNRPLCSSSYRVSKTAHNSAVSRESGSGILARVGLESEARQATRALSHPPPFVSLPSRRRSLLSRSLLTGLHKLSPLMLPTPWEPPPLPA